MGQARWSNLVGDHRISTSHHHRHHGHHHQHKAMTRRQFVTRSAGAGLAAAAITTVGSQANAGAHPRRGSPIPEQLPDFSPALFGEFGIEIPFLLPAEIDPFINPGPIGDPTTFDHFTGKMAMVEIEGVSDNNSEGVPRTWAADARFWEGRFIDRGGHIRNGAFTFL